MANQERLAATISAVSDTYVVGGGLHYKPFDQAWELLQNVNVNGGGGSESVVAEAERFRKLVKPDRDFMLREGYLDQAGQLTALMGAMGRFTVSNELDSEPEDSRGPRRIRGLLNLLRYKL